MCINFAPHRLVFAYLTTPFPVCLPATHDDMACDHNVVPTHRTHRFWHDEKRFKGTGDDSLMQQGEAVRHAHVYVRVCVPHGTVPHTHMHMHMHMRTHTRAASCMFPSYTRAHINKITFA